MRNYLKLCRLCAEHKKNMPNVTLLERNRKCLSRKILQLTGIQLENNKRFPSIICLDCEMELNRAYEFRQRCITAQAFFACSKNDAGIIHRSCQYEDIKDDERELPEENPIELPEENIIELENKREIEISVKTELSEECEFTSTKKINVLQDYDIASVDENVQKLLVCYESSNGQMEIELETEPDAIAQTTLIENMHVLKLPLTEITKKPQKLQCSRERRKRKERKNLAKTYICEQCGNTFKNRSNFKSHINRHKGEKSLQCEVCPNKFFTQGELKRHMRRHTGERPFACQYCQRRFGDYSTRIKHERTHTNERPFECPHCDKAFTTSYVLKNHILTHTGERSFECKFCKKSFQRETHLVVHTRSLAHKQNVERTQQNRHSEIVENFSTTQNLATN